MLHKVSLAETLFLWQVMTSSWACVGKSFIEGSSCICVCPDTDFSSDYSNRSACLNQRHLKQLSYKKGIMHRIHGAKRQSQSNPDSEEDV